MTEIRVTAEGAVGAPVHRTYRSRYLADYREHHHRFLPPAFADWRVEEGGVGAGTVVRFRVTPAGRARDVPTTIAEPEPGRIATESEPATGTVTTFAVTPDGDRSRVRVETAWTGAGGVAGVAERLLVPRLLRRLSRDELARLDRYVRGQAV